MGLALIAAPLRFFASAQNKTKTHLLNIISISLATVAAVSTTLVTSSNLAVLVPAKAEYCSLNPPTTMVAGSTISSNTNPTTPKSISKSHETKFGLVTSNVSVLTCLADSLSIAENAFSFRLLSWVKLLPRLRYVVPVPVHRATFFLILSMSPSPTITSMMPREATDLVFARALVVGDTLDDPEVNATDWRDEELVLCRLIAVTSNSVTFTASLKVIVINPVFCELSMVKSYESRVGAIVSEM